MILQGKRWLSVIGPISSNQWLLQLFQPSGTGSLINGAGYGFTGNQPLTVPMSGTQSLAQMLQDGGTTQSASMLINGVSFSSPSYNTLGNLLANSQNSIGSIIDQYI